MAFTLPQLPYAFDALEPHIDATTMQIHHGKHHQTYVNSLNSVLDLFNGWPFRYPDEPFSEKSPWLEDWPLEDLMREINSVPEPLRPAFRDSVGGHWNHSMFWEWMSPKGGEPTGALADAIQDSFGGLDKFKEQWSDAGGGRWGSGWVWLLNGGGKLSIASTPNQDNLLMEGKTAILGLDVWEHAYYLKYQNRRPDYIAAWWNVVNWEKVQELYGK